MGSEIGSGDAFVTAAVADLDQAVAHWDETARAELTKAVRYGILAHTGQFRRSGEPYITHPLAVATIVAGLGAQPVTVIGAVLHDTVEDTSVTLEDVREEFGPQVAVLVDGATKVAAVRGDHPDRTEAERLRKLFVALAADPRVVTIKLADRLHNLRTIGSLPSAKAARIGRESLAIHGPLAHRLGFALMKAELEDRAFAVALPDEYLELRAELVNRPHLEDTLQEAMTALDAHLNATDGSTGRHRHQITGRIKHLWSIYRKTHVSGRDLESLHDLIGVRVLVDDVEDCYRVLGLVHALWEPVPDRFKDYIARPKFNAYRSLHTTVLLNGRMVEVQVRTHEMHTAAENGSAAHHAYKHETGTEPQWLSRVLDWHDDSVDDTEYLSAVAGELRSEEIWVLTPRGDVISLPAGSSVVDFAYAVHSQIGDRVSGARVNGALVPLSTRLISGNTVEIITRRTTGPSLDWLEWTVTARARQRIRAWHTRQRRDSDRASGEAALVQLLSRKRVLPRAQAESALLRATGLDSLEALAEEVGAGRIELETLAEALASSASSVSSAPATAPSTPAPRSAPADDETPPGPAPTPAGVPLLHVTAPGLTGVTLTWPGCCHAVPGRGLLGVLSRTRGIVVHASDCPQALASLAKDPARNARLAWVRAGSHLSMIDLVCENTPGMVARVTVALAGADCDIEASSSYIGEDGAGHQSYEVVHHTSRAELVTRLRELPGVRSALVR
ncbi:RelA/SpoT family protein [Kineosporia succinea]|uniref:GTP pyrophosphokinase n=1 Tax=Kineosporia succinea TaxID=84632 RepID=A0ABT9P840_9ACTN|nr:RelA/SpoT family protein [Kineosporia succinea]MDP9828864.1 GTP pyrophosphokinase [Kineosporia succinea]